MPAGVAQTQLVGSPASLPGAACTPQQLIAGLVDGRSSLVPIYSTPIGQQPQDARLQRMSAAAVALPPAAHRLAAPLLSSIPLPLKPGVLQRVCIKC